MKIIRVCTLLDFGGLEQRLVNISQIQDEHEWIFCALGTGGKASEEILNNGKKVILLNIKYTIPSVIAIRKLVSVFKKEKPDVVHTSGAEANFHGIIAAKIVGVTTLIAEEIGIPNQKGHHKFVFKFLYRLPSYVVANSKPVATYLKTENGVDSNCLRIIPNPLKSVPHKIIPQSNSKEFQLLTISRLKTVKNIEGVLRVIAFLIKENHSLKFTIIGDGDNLQALKNIVNKLEITKHVDFKGFTTEPLSTISTTNLFILNSFTEGFSNALTEAMGAGIPCLSTDVGAASEQIRENETGWLVKAGNDKALYEKIKHILTLEKKKLAEIGLNGRNFIKTTYHLDKHRAKLIELYQN